VQTSPLWKTARKKLKRRRGCREGREGEVRPFHRENTHCHKMIGFRLMLLGEGMIRVCSRFFLLRGPH
jgi:hypothetical protein